MKRNLIMTLKGGKGVFDGMTFLSKREMVNQLKEKLSPLFSCRETFALLSSRLVDDGRHKTRERERERGG